MKEQIVEGRNEEEALLKASEVLGVNISDMQYEVIEHETGLFGLFHKSVKVRVRVPDEVPGIVYRNGNGPQKARADGPAPEAESKAEAPVPEPAAEKGPQAQAALQGILERMGVQADVTVTEDAESVRLNIATDERDVVIGRDGEVLSALQFVLNKMINRFPEDRKRIVLDAEGFRDQRASELTEMARRLGEKAVRTGRTVRVAAMNAQDRRVVHMALKDYPGVTTRSEGEGLFRCLFIVPTDSRRGGRPGRGSGPAGRRAPRPRPAAPREPTS